MKILLLISDTYLFKDKKVKFKISDIEKIAKNYNEKIKEYPDKILPFVYEDLKTNDQKVIGWVRNLYSDLGHLIAEVKSIPNEMLNELKNKEKYSLFITFKRKTDLSHIALLKEPISLFDDIELIKYSPNYQSFSFNFKKEDGYISGINEDIIDNLRIELDRKDNEIDFLKKQIELFTKVKYIYNYD